MAPVTYTVVTRDNRRFNVPADTEETVLQLAKRVAEATGFDRDSFDLLPKGRQTFLSQYKGSTELQEISALKNETTLLLFVRPGRWRYNYNVTSITNPNNRRYHTRILEEKLKRIQQNRQGQGHPLGGKRKTRKSKKSRKQKQTRRR